MPQSHGASYCRPISHRQRQSYSYPDSCTGSGAGSDASICPDPNLYAIALFGRYAGPAAYAQAIHSIQYTYANDRTYTNPYNLPRKGLPD